MLIAAIGQYFFGITIFLSSMFLIMLVLVQRGRGGGLAGALGGPGGQSAFGTKAGDLFTRITIVVASVWIFLCAAAVFFLKEKKFETNVTRTTVNTPAATIGGEAGQGETAPLTGETSNPAGSPGLDLQNLPPATPAETTPPAGEAEVTELPTLETTPTETPPAETTTPETPAPAPAAKADESTSPAAEPPAGSGDTPAAAGSQPTADGQ